MPSRILRSTAVSLLGALMGALSGASLATAAEVPSLPPSHLVWEARKVLTLATRRKLESFLLQHQHLTGERVFIAIHPWEENAPETEIRGKSSSASRWLFDRWGLETIARGSNALLLLTETGPSRLKISLQLGLGITPPEGRSTSSMTERLEDFASEARSLGSWDAIGLAAVRSLLEELDSPVLSRLQDDAWEVEPHTLAAESQADLPKEQGRSGGRGSWATAIFLLLLGSTSFYLIFDQRMTQEVLMGPDRWLVLGPRLKLSLWWKRRQAAKDLSSGSPSGRWIELKERA